ncbi:MAG: hypothetical protein R3F46_11005 [bacterium]
MQRRLARSFMAWGLGTVVASMVCVGYMFALPSPLQLPPLEVQQAPQVTVASQPSRLAFIAFSGENTIRGFWKDPQDSAVNFTIEIDPGNPDEQLELPAADEPVPAGDSGMDGEEDSSDQSVMEDAQSSF